MTRIDTSKIEDNNFFSTIHLHFNGVAFQSADYAHKAENKSYHHHFTTTEFLTARDTTTCSSFYAILV